MAQIIRECLPKTKTLMDHYLKLEVSLWINQNFFGSDYFYQKIGLDLTDVQTQLEQNNSRLVGDQFFQTKIIEEQLKTIRKNSFYFHKVKQM